MPQDCPDYSQADAKQLNEEEAAFQERKSAKKGVWNVDADVAVLPHCTCKGSPFGMDVDRCPVHGEGCA